MSAKGCGDRADDDANEDATLGRQGAPHIPKSVAGSRIGSDGHDREPKGYSGAAAYSGRLGHQTRTIVSTAIVRRPESRPKWSVTKHG